MIIYNVTINVDETIHQEWLVWIKQHIKQVLATELFLSAYLTKVLVDEALGGTTYSVQFKAPSRVALETYYNEHAENLRLQAQNQFGDKILAFRTELEVIEEFNATHKSKH